MRNRCGHTGVTGFKFCLKLVLRRKTTENIVVAHQEHRVRGGETCMLDFGDNIGHLNRYRHEIPPGMFMNSSELQAHVLLPITILANSWEQSKDDIA